MNSNNLFSSLEGIDLISKMEVFANEFSVSFFLPGFLVIYGNAYGPFPAHGDVILLKRYNSAQSRL